MTVITDQQDLVDLCNDLSGQDFITVDTEFLRDKTYYPQLCLIQVAAMGGDPYAIDPLAAGIDLQPFLDLMFDETIIKVFHATRQDIEIFYNLTGKIPHPLFDTQVAAMVCGYGESIGYLNLVQAICGTRLDKGAQFTDWSRRPLSNKQITYALGDVTHLRDVYLHLSGELDKKDRTKWVRTEMEVLTSPKTYENPPEESWRRVKIKSDKPRVLAVLKELAAWRELEARRRNVPRPRVLRDETLVDMAVHAPKNAEELSHIRNVSRDMAQGKLGQALLAVIQKGRNIAPEDCPKIVRRERFPQELTPVLEMLKMLLRIQASEHGVAAKLIVGNGDLETLVLNDDRADIPALKGWRYEVFGKEALAMKQGRISLSLQNNEIQKKNV